MRRWIRSYPFSKPLYYADVVMVSTDNARKLQKAAPIRVIHHSPVHFWMHERDSLLKSMKDSIEHLGTDLSRELALAKGSQ